MKKETTEGNALIAEFMEVPPCARCEEPYCKSNAPKYNEYWDRLMPVVEKIENLGHSVLIDGVACKIFLDYDHVHAYKESKIEAVYDCVVRFIHYHNSLNSK